MQLTYISSCSLGLVALLGHLAFGNVVAPRQAQTYPDPLPCVGHACQNRALADMNFIVSDGTYYRYSKCNETGKGGIEVATAKSLRGRWTYRDGSILNGHLKDPVFLPNHTNIGSPEVHFINGTYYLFYGLYSSNGFDIAVATSKTMDQHSWVDHGSIGIPASPYDGKRKLYSAIGPTLLVNSSAVGEASSDHYLAFGSYATGIYGIHMQNPPLRVRPNEKPKKLIADQPIPKVDGNTRHNRTEGPLLYKRGPGQYFLFYSRGENSAKINSPLSIVYRIEVCRAPAVDGPYKDKNNLDCLGDKNQSGTLVLETHSNRTVFAPGGVGIFRDPMTYGLVLTYQYLDASSKEAHRKGRRFGYNYLEFIDDWPKLVAERGGS